ncbi:MAG TPA: prolipoprotein diacylglyceryl transferase family protein [Candidatus Deferrimicrobium sp.]|nr:prolipoprotein diacylglyceryl transferase family protein [Candidatus Deferrimicrobium sp.]
MYPILFYLNGSPVSSYRFFNGLAILLGAVLYFRLTNGDKSPLENRIYLWTAGLTGGFVGAKSVDIFLNFKLVIANVAPYLRQEVGSRTILGGIIGGYLGVKLVKAFLGIKEKTGDPFALAAIMGMGIGRIGCFLGASCLGKPAQGWFAVYMAGAYRYPTQLIEVMFDFLLFTLLWLLRGKLKYPGDLFKLFVTSYALFRFVIEFYRTELVVWQGLTVYQIIAFPLMILGGIYFLVRYMFNWQGTGEKV